MTGLFASLDLSIAMALLIRVCASAVGVTSIDDARRRRLPRAGLLLWLWVALPSLTQLAWPHLLLLWRRDPAAVLQHHEYWRLCTAIVVQDGGIAGTAFNLVSLALIATLGCWFWGGRRAAAIFVATGVGLNMLGTLYGSVGAGNSGATYALAASVAGSVLVNRRGREQVGAAATLLFGAMMWWVVADPHGIAILAGGLVGSVLSLWRPPLYQPRCRSLLVADQGSSSA